MGDRSLGKRMWREGGRDGLGLLLFAVGFCKRNRQQQLLESSDRPTAISPIFRPFDSFSQI